MGLSVRILSPSPPSTHPEEPSGSSFLRPHAANDALSASASSPVAANCFCASNMALRALFVSACKMDFSPDRS